MQERTRSILKGTAVFAAIFACVSSVVIVYARVTEFNALGDISMVEWLSIFGQALAALILMFVVTFLMFGSFALILVGVVQYIYDRFYRTPVL